MSHKITPFIRSNDNGAAMADYYLAIFPDAKLIARNSFVSTIEIFGSQISTLQG
jgi:predicted 3-demethylubiquinone-9 3-methyltransferase (glyoxalase superfamily)